MILPTIHTNETSAEMLREGYGAARLACVEAGRMMAAIEFNARDYYPQGSSAVQKSRAEHDARFEKLNSIIAELQAIEFHIQDRIDEREAWKAARQEVQS